MKRRGDTCCWESALTKIQTDVFGTKPSLLTSSLMLRDGVLWKVIRIWAHHVKLDPLIQSSPYQPTKNTIIIFTWPTIQPSPYHNHIRIQSTPHQQRQQLLSWQSPVRTQSTSFLPPKNSPPANTMFTPNTIQLIHLVIQSLAWQQPRNPILRWETKYIICKLKLK